MGLRKAGNHPGIITSSTGFKPVDSLIVKTEYIADSLGITKIHPTVAKEVRQYLEKFDTLPPSDTDWEQLWKNEVISGKAFQLLREQYAINSGQLSSDFTQFIQKITAKAVDERTEVENAMLEFTKSLINEEGFRSISFVNFQDTLPKVLLLGDSFTWGHSASNPAAFSFANLLMAQNFVVYNTGIPGADPAQYLAIARKYILILQPDVVVVNFFTGNDIMYFHRQPKPFTPLYHKTNAGNLYACPNGIYFDTPQQVYNFVLRESSILGQSHHFFNRLCAKMVMTTRLWKVLEQMGWVNITKDPDIAAYWQKADSLRSPIPISEMYMDSIKSVAHQHHAAILLSVIPTLNELGEPFTHTHPLLFQHTQWHYPEELTHNDYDPKTEHFNDSGHQKYAAFLAELIDSVLLHRIKQDTIP